KNDGYIPSSGTYFQVYAPEDPTARRSISSAVAKVQADFDGLLKKWDPFTPIKVFRFVFNDSYHGSPLPLETAIATIQTTHRIDSRSFLAKDLENEAIQLVEDELVDVVNTPIPDLGLLPDVDFGVLREVINHVLNTGKASLSQFS